MTMAYKYVAMSLVSLALANGWPCFQPACRGAEPTQVNLAERIKALEAEDPGLLPMDPARHFSSSIMTEASRAGLTVLSATKVTSRTNQSFTALQRNLAIEATEPQLLDFLRNIAASNSPLRIQALSVRPIPDRSRLHANLALVGDYRLPAAGQSLQPDAAQVEYAVLSQRRHLRKAALDCYDLTKSTLPSGWQLDSLGFQDGRRLSAQGQAPADQVRCLHDVLANLEKAQAPDGRDLFVPSSGQTTMRMITPGLTNFSWSMELELRSPESR